MGNSKRTRKYSDNLILELSNGGTIPLKPATAKKSGNDFWCVTGKFNSYGYSVAGAQVGGSVPTSFTFDGVTVEMSGGVNGKGNLSMAGDTTFEHDDQTFKIGLRITQLVNKDDPSDVWYNVTSSAHRKGGKKKGNTSPRTLVTL